MLDLKFIRANADLVQEHLAHKGIEGGNALIQKVIELDAARRESLVQVETLKKSRNELSAQVAKLRKNGENADDLMNQSREIGERITGLDASGREIETELDALLLEIPNIHAPEVPIGAGEDENVEVRRVGTPKTFDFEPLPHFEIGEKLGILDFERAAKISGARFSVLKGAGARLERALISFMLDVHTGNHGYEEILPPVLVRSSAMEGAGILPKFAEDAYKVENQDLWLIPTAEVPVTAFHADEILEAAQLPIKYVAYSACFRSEAGSAGRDTRGLIRVHQFNKVELVWLTHPEKSYQALEQLRADAEKILELLELPFRTVEHCSGDLGFKATKSYDPEVWFPSQNTYREISSCSNFEAFQARRSGIRFRTIGEGGKPNKPEFVHTLNGSGLAIGRTLAAILENNQNADGSVSIPQVLRPYMGGIETIS
ncbi:seryl-tRNA synthetase [Abditibacterium utsteinense]|uniref:Serine--tRNA ligase n=1 Tax=Abditibacterium utsteinense TaxID=1960156 RepID=A0A2S8SP39_9BACT|nr:serine--tRNA ligase [Abditibacterium utsteinense]PQV62546.1 seryl-tRNA synthetase [Abditibacterium utsteinense]